ncbi:hypothetical protein H4582DRAFT_2061538 [Lactarius indigo]|nr:hypothetical protein H4582DRAFT_2061538 [Lactarius indigo]
MSTYLTGFGNGLESGSFGDVGLQAHENQGQWQFNSIGNGAGNRQSAFGSQAVQNTDVILGIVAGASEATLERNAFYVGLKTMASNRATEVEALKGTIEQKIQEIVGCKKEIDILKARCETLEGTIDRFARDYHSLRDAGDDTGPIAFMTDLGPMPTPWKRDDNPDVTIWMKREYTQEVLAANARKGETSGDPSDTAKTKGRVGRPSKKDQGETGHKHIYLQDRDGIPISVETLGKMSVKARSIWDFLLKKKMATPTFGKLPWDAWDLYARAMLTDCQFDFLLLCDDATWKLHEWSTQNYPGWAGNRGLRTKIPNQDAGKNEDALNDPTLIRMKSSDGTNDPNDNIQPADRVLEGDNNRIAETTLEPNDVGFPEAVDNPDEGPGPLTQPPQGPVVSEENPAPSTQLVRRILPILDGANIRPKPQGPIQSVIANPFAPTTSNLPLGSHAGVTRINPSPTDPASSAPVQTSKDPTTTTQTHATPSDVPRGASAAVPTETHPGPDVPSRLIGTTPPGGSSTTATTSGAIPPRPRIKLKLNPPVKSTATREDQDLAAPPMPSEPTQTPAPGPSDGQTPDPVHPDPPPVNPAIPNLRLERAMANAEKKRKAEGKTTTAASKKQKTANGLAEPTSTITIKNICMRQWNERQPGGQGLAADFDAYFKGLSDVDKEAHYLVSLRPAVQKGDAYCPSCREEGEGNFQEAQ